MSIEINAASKGHKDLKPTPPAPPPERKKRLKKNQPKPEKPDLEGAKWKKGFKPKKVRAKAPPKTIPVEEAKARNTIYHDDPLKGILTTIPTAQVGRVVEDDPLKALAPPKKAGAGAVLRQEELTGILAPIPTKQNAPVHHDDPLDVAFHETAVPIPSANVAPVVHDDPFAGAPPPKPIPSAQRQTIFLDDDGQVVAPIPTAQKGIVYLDHEVVPVPALRSAAPAKVQRKSPSLKPKESHK